MKFWTYENNKNNIQNCSFPRNDINVNSYSQMDSAKNLKLFIHRGTNIPHKRVMPLQMGLSCCACVYIGFVNISKVNMKPNHLRGPRWKLLLDIYWFLKEIEILSKCGSIKTLDKDYIKARFELGSGLPSALSSCLTWSKPFNL